MSTGVHVYSLVSAMATSNSEVKPSDNSKDLTNDAGQEEDIDSQEEARQVMAENLIKVLEDELEGMLTVNFLELPN